MLLLSHPPLPMLLPHEVGVAQVRAHSCWARSGADHLVPMSVPPIMLSPAACLATASVLPPRSPPPPPDF